MKTTPRSSLFVPATIQFATALVAMIGSQPRQALAQGCVASPGNPACLMMPGEHAEHGATASRLTGTIAYRWYESARHFGGRTRAGVWLDGDEENTDRETYGQQMINKVSLINVTLTYGITARWSASLDIPYIDAERNSLFEHGDGQRHSMYSSGLGDIRLTTDYWLFDPHKHMDGNIALGVGVKAPTGDDKATDTSFRGAGPVNRPVDQSIQPGDGGWGIVLQLQAYQKIVQNLFAYVQGSYLINPKEHNDTQMVNADMMARNAMTFNSVSDQYFGRGGVSYRIWPAQGVTLSFGGRIEGVPVYDAINGSLGYRQPGYTISVEPGIVWAGEKNSLSILAPVAVYRNRERSAPEIEMNRPGGDASFADYSILVSFSRRF
jgi:hypothetical protein